MGQNLTLAFHQRSWSSLQGLPALSPSSSWPWEVPITDHELWNSTEELSTPEAALWIFMELPSTCHRCQRDHQALLLLAYSWSATWGYKIFPEFCNLLSSLCYSLILQCSVLNHRLNEAWWIPHKQRAINPALPKCSLKSDLQFLSHLSEEVEEGCILTQLNLWISPWFTLLTVFLFLRSSLGSLLNLPRKLIVSVGIKQPTNICLKTVLL